MEYSVPRIVLAGTNSGCGKTTVSCGILQALVNRGLKTEAFKCGPDFIDPMFHSKIIGVKSGTLDSFFFSHNTLNYLLAKNGAECDINILEGVMGFYDGAGMTTKASTYEIARITGSPVVLVVDAKGAALSLLATIHGFLSLFSDNRICGVIFNRCSATIYRMLSAEIKNRFGGQIVPLGYLPRLSHCVFESRHLGLITADEIFDLKEKLRILARQTEETIELDSILRLAKNAPSVSCDPIVIPKFQDTVRIGVATDNAFCFYYKDNLELLREMGAELIPFSPLTDTALPKQIHGIYFGGGYPEVYAEQLSGNQSMLSSVRKRLEEKIPCIAECGGFMYLTEKIGAWNMVGYLPGNSYDTGKLTRFGYVTLKAKKDCLLCKKGEEIQAHEFHYWDSSQNGNGFTARKASGKEWDCVIANEHLYAGYPHFHFYSNIEFAVNFYQACLKEKQYHD